jgi:hypothetical protein
LLNATSRVVGKAKRLSEEIAQGAKRATMALKQLVLKACARRRLRASGQSAQNPERSDQGVLGACVSVKKRTCAS